MRHRSKNAVLYDALTFFGVVFIIVGVAMFAMTEGVRDWPTTTGTVTESYVVDNGSSFYPWVEYRYMVGGVEYLNHKIKYLEDSEVTNRAVAEAVVERYPAGSSVIVHYDAGDPDSSVLEVSQGTFSYLTLLVAGTLLSIGVVGMVWTMLSKSEVTVGRAMGRGRARWIDPISGPVYNFDASWEPCLNDVPLDGERILWRGTPVKPAFVLSLGRASALSFILLAALVAVSLTIGAAITSLNSLAIGGFVFLGIVLVAASWYVLRQGRRYPGTEYIVTDWRVFINDGAGGCRSVSLLTISRVLICETFSDRIYRTGSLVVSDTTRADLIGIKEPLEIKRIIKEAMVDAWKRQNEGGAVLV